MNTPITAWVFFSIDTEGRKEGHTYYQSKQAVLNRMNDIAVRYDTEVRQDAMGTQFWVYNTSSSQKWVMEMIKIA